MKDLSITRFKAHDCHVMLTVFLPIAIRIIKLDFLKMAITRMCYFFSKISQKTIGKKELSDLHGFVVETQNQLEMCLPPAFFNIMPHLMIHIVHQIEALSPCYLHEMWSYEWFMLVLNQYVHNLACLEGYITEEIIECCQEYLKGQKGIGKPDSLHQGRLARKGTRERKVFIDEDYKEVSRVHYSVMQSIELIKLYIDEHLAIIREESNVRTNE
jgi:hypothetical protein